MKLDNKLVCHFLLANMCLCLTGCGSISSYEPLGSGYIWVTHTQNSFSEPSSHQFALQYSPGKDKWWIMVWPDLGGVKVTNGVAVYIGEKASKKPEHFGDRWPLKSRLFAVRAPEMPMDITDEVLWRGTKSSGEDFSKLLKTATIAYFKETNNTVEFHFGVMRQPDFPELTIPLNWDQISDVMREVKEKGVVRKDRVWGTSYIEKEFKPEVQK